MASLWRTPPLISLAKALTVLLVLYAFYAVYAAVSGVDWQQEKREEEARDFLEKWRGSVGGGDAKFGDQ